MFKDKDPSKRDLNKRYMEIKRLCESLTKDDKQIILWFYGGGHGTIHNEKQFLMLNEDSPKDALFDF